ncbi:MAG: T9SS type A sorting domain-containing protein [Vicingaceae bacterium]
MKKLLFIFLSTSFSLVAIAQPSNATVYDCDTNSRTIYDVLGTGKSIIVLSKGVDCSICRNAAPGWQTWASNNKTEVEVWGAITYLYNQSNFSPPCTATNKWINDFSWTDIFTFADSSRDWYQSGTPRYYVYSAIDSTITYQGGSSSAARSNAIAQSTVGLSNVFDNKQLLYIYSKQQIQLKQVPSSVDQFRLVDLSGRIVNEGNVNSSLLSIQVGNLNKGVYILQLFNRGNAIGQRKAMIY